MCFLQLKSPFFDEICWVDSTEYNKFGWLHYSNKKRQEKIKRLLDDIKNFNRHIDVLIFPEYAIHKETLDYLKEFSERNKTIVIVNYYDDDLRYSMTSIIFPNKEVYYQPKINYSDHDIDFLSKVL